MNLQPITALSPLDGRYESKVSALRGHFSEFGLIESAFVTEADDRTSETFSITHDPFVVHAPPPDVGDV